METQTQEIEQLQKEIEERRSRIVKLRRAQPLEELKDYTFKTRENKEVTLMSLFGDSDELMIMHIWENLVSTVLCEQMALEATQK